MTIVILRLETLTCPIIGQISKKEVIKMTIRNTIIRVWQGTIRPAEALEEIRDEIRKGKKRVSEINGDLLCLLEGVKERLLTVGEAEEEIRWAIERPRRKNRKGGALIVPIFPA